MNSDKALRKLVTASLRLLDLTRIPLDEYLSDPDVQIFLKNTYWCEIKKDFVTITECNRCWEENYSGNVEDDLRFKMHKSQYLKPISEDQKEAALAHVVKFLRKDMVEEFASIMATLNEEEESDGS